MAASAQQEAIYQPLSQKQDEIRLVKLLPATEHDEVLHCHLVTTPLSPSLQFQSLSYAWGRTPADATLHVGGKQLLITKNLEEALRAIRHKDTIIHIWVDAICINQQDVTYVRPVFDIPLPKIGRVSRTRI